MTKRAPASHRSGKRSGLAWNCPTREGQEAFRAFIFGELDRRFSAQTDAMAASLQDEEAGAGIASLLAGDFERTNPEKRGRGRPPVHPVERQFVPSEDAARTVEVIREIFADEWDGARNRKRPSAVELAAEYCGVGVGEIETRMKRAKARRP